MWEMQQSDIFFDTAIYTHCNDAIVHIKGILFSFRFILTLTNVKAKTNNRQGDSFILTKILNYVLFFLTSILK